ncbi:MAG: enoyl-CoA hydratase/isomerase family protein [Syntrophomonadaceae bacterium]
MGNIESLPYRQKEYRTLLIEFADDVAVLKLNRPKANNALNSEMLDELIEVMSQIAVDGEIRVLILGSSGRSFSAGGDVESFSRFGSSEAHEFAERVVHLERLVVDLPQPTIAAVSGFALGGGMEMVLMCDLRIAADNARFGQPEINLGIIPGAGATQRLVQNISPCQAKEMIFLGETIRAAAAFEMGIVNAVVPLDKLMETALKWAKKLAAKPPLALQIAKKAINAAWSCDIETGMKMECEAWSLLYDTEDQKEGMMALLEKRKPVFKGR